MNKSDHCGCTKGQQVHLGEFGSIEYFVLYKMLSIDTENEAVDAYTFAAVVESQHGHTVHCRVFSSLILAHYVTGCYQSREE